MPYISETNVELQNEKCYIVYRPEDKEIFCRDLTDRNNEPAIFNKLKRNIKHAWKEIQDSWTPETKMRDVCDILTKWKIRYHYWCMMD